MPPSASLTRGGAEPPGLLESIGRYWKLLVVLSAIGLLGGVALGALQPPTYETTAHLRLADPQAQGFLAEGGTLDEEGYIARQIDLTRSQLVTTRAAELAGGGITPETVSSATEVVGDAEILSLEITAWADTGPSAALLANALSEAYQEVRAERHREEGERLIAELRAAESALNERIAELEDELEAEGEEPSSLVLARHQSLIDRLVDTESRIQEIIVEVEIVGSGVTMVESAPAPEAPAGPGPLLLGLLGLLVGAGVAGSVAYWKAGRTSRIWKAEDAAEILQVPLLGRLPSLPPRGRSLDEVVNVTPEEAEAFDFLLTSLEYELARLRGSSILITSSAPGQGKTTTTVHLGLACARGDRDVLLVDGDLRSQRLSGLFGLDGVPGLAELDDGSTTDLVEMIHTTDRRLNVLPAGRAGHAASSFLRRETFRSRFRRLREAVDLMLVDSAPMLAAADSTVLAGLVDGVVLLVHERSPTWELTRVKEHASFMGAPLLGFVYVGGGGGLDAYYGYHAERDDVRERGFAEDPAGSATEPAAGGGQMPDGRSVTGPGRP